MSWIQTKTGKRVFPLDSKPETIDIEDIAHALGNCCRFAGHTRWFYSVAEHSVKVSYLLPQGLKLWGLLHDASEAYLVDIPRPVKRAPEFAFYREAEARLMEVIAGRFGLQWPEPPEVKHADNVMLMAEQRDFMGPQLHPWDESEKYSKEADERVKPCLKTWHPVTAYEMFMLTFNMLKVSYAGCV